MQENRFSKDYLRVKKELSDSLGALESPKKAEWKSGFESVSLFEELSSLVHRLRTQSPPNDPLLRDAEDFLAISAQRLLGQQDGKSDEKNAQTLTQKYRIIWRENISLFVFTLLFFMASTLAGYIVVKSRPEFSSAILGQHMVEDILDGQRWYDRLNQNPLMGAYQIATNNIKVSITAFALGGLLGLGGLYILVFNGLMVGSVVAFCQINHFDDPLWGFMISHGPLELSIIVVSVFSGLLFGRCFYTRSKKRRRERLALGAREAFIIISLSVPWLVIAAIFEAFVSPQLGLDPSLKLAWGLIIGAIFWGWTFWPARVETKPRAST